MTFQELSNKVSNEAAKSFERRRSLENTGNSLDKKPGQVNFLGSIPLNLQNIMPELIKAIKQNPEILEVEVPEFKNPWKT